MRFPWPDATRRTTSALALSRSDIIATVGLIAALGFYRRVPLLLWLCPVGAIFGLTISEIRFAASSKQALLLLRNCGIACGLSLLLLGVRGYDNVALGQSTWLDDLEYYRQGIEIAAAWKRGWFPALSAHGSLPYLGTVHTGYPRVVASCFYLFGSRPIWLIGLNVVCSTLFPVLVYSLTRTLFALTANGEHPADTARASVNASLIWAFHPATAYWTTTMMRDLMLAFLFTAALGFLLLWLHQKGRLWYAIGFVLLLWQVTLFRAYASASLLAGLGAYVLTFLPRRKAAWLAFYGVLLFWFACYGALVDRYVGTLEHSLLSLAPKAAYTRRGMIAQFIAAAPRLWLSPYAWVKAAGGRPVYVLFPGMWYLYFVVYPLGFTGLVFALRRNHCLSAVTLLSVLSSFLVFVITYGDVSRQRLYLEPIFAAYAGLGTVLPNRRLGFVVIYALVFSFALIQLVSLYFRH